jgi:hypothetical protein
MRRRLKYSQSGKNSRSCVILGLVSYAVYTVSNIPPDLSVKRCVSLRLNQLDLKSKQPYLTIVNLLSEL